MSLSRIFRQSSIRLRMSSKKHRRPSSGSRGLQCKSAGVGNAFATGDAARKVTGWGVIEDFTGSDHQYIEFQVRDLRNSRDGCVTKPSSWNATRLKVERFGLPVDGCVEDVVKDTMNLIHKTCDASMPRKKPFRGRKATY